MSTLKDFQFEILPSVDAADGVVFGIHSDVSLNEDGFHPGSTDWAVQDTQSSATGNTLFGRDLLLGGVWAWDLHVNRDDCEDALASLAEHTTAWRWLDGRDSPGVVTSIRYNLGGRIRRIYGRPGKHEASPNNLILSGYTDVTCDFSAIDGFTYADEATGVILTLGAADEDTVSGGGLVFPTVLPVNSQVATEAARTISVAGDAPTYAVYTLNGPWVNPSVYTDDWILSLPDYEIPDGQFVVIDTRPWARTVMLNGTTSIGGKIGRRQKLYKAKLKPGDFEVRIGGYSTTGTANCQISWRDTYNSI
jgi:hypothetical protein